MQKSTSYSEEKSVHHQEMFKEKDFFFFFFFHRTLHNVKSFFFRVRKKLPRKPFSRRSKSLHPDNLYISFLNVLESDLEKANDTSSLEQTQEEEEGEKPRAFSRSWRRQRDREAFEKKVKEMDMIESGDIEDALDVEEAVHYYSRLRSPVYLDIVDKFFADLYSDLSLPQTSSVVRAKASKRRVGSVLTF
ncbi:PREDICTED: uncharacterized protein LOC104810523 [Tarenaya hassleriana]|uniref:uncharacterized protein LOC104810523 n=1 Tax=Tarenaya hassleriana TaxID=28532 RepID=UPI00053C30F1|nr:PREDICTED: uncharacterized protein LOC104810523 [Tarenaya hassleriana]